jgi:cation transport protein ChaC
MSAAAGECWIFAYGSLMWRPGFPFEVAGRARLTGFRRCFCIYSMHHRGSPRRPGLVLGLDRSGICEGIAYRVASDKAREVIDYLRAREQISGVYREMMLPVELAGTRREVSALAYVVDRAHPIYAGSLSPARQAQLIRAGHLGRQPRLSYQHAAASGRNRHPRARAGTRPRPHRAAHGASSAGGPDQPVCRRIAADRAAAAGRGVAPPEARRAPALSLSPARGRRGVGG